MGQFIKPKNHEDLIRRVTSFSLAGAQCIAQCTGCQCNKTVYDVTDAYNVAKNNHVFKPTESKAEFIAPEKKVYEHMIKNVVMSEKVAAAPCNCTACNACRCDCSCRSIEFSGQSIW